MMVQFAAFKAGCRGWFERYAVLGDDLVIADYRVAREYLELCRIIGVEVNLSKSIVSNNLSLEFAKRFFWKGEEVTPIPLLGLAVGWLGVRDIAEIASQVKSRSGRTPSLYMIGRFVNLGLKTCSGLGQKLIFSMGRKARSIVLLLTRPGAVYGVENLLKWYTLTRATGQNISVEGAWDAMADATRHRISHFVSLNLRRRLFKAMVSFDISRFYKTVKPFGAVGSDRMGYFGLSTWWEENVIAPFKAPILKRLDEVDAMISEIDRVLAKRDEAQLLKLLEAMEELEEQVALVPSEVKFERTEQEMTGRKTDKFPKRVRGWTKLIRKFRRAYQDCRHK
jgi:hypothetical protein